MLNAGMLSFNAGRLRVTVAAPAVTVGGTPVAAAGALAIDTGGPVVYVHGAPFAANGALCLTQLDPPTSFDQGMPFITDRVSHDPVGAIAFYCYGLPYTATGALATVIE